MKQHAKFAKLQSWHRASLNIPLHSQGKEFEASLHQCFSGGENITLILKSRGHDGRRLVKYFS